MSRLLSLCICFAITLCGCSKKEILSGTREEIEGITYAELHVSDEIKDRKISLPPPSSATELTRLLDNQQHLSMHHVLSASPKVIWHKSLGRLPIVSNILIIGKCIYSISGDGTLCCLDKDTGKRLWLHKISTQPQFGRFVGGITAHGSIIYIACNTSELVAFDFVHRKILWRKTLDDMVKGTPVCVSGKIIANTASNKTYAINPNNGDILWKYESSPEAIAIAILGTPAVYKNSAICVYSNGDIVSLNLSDGSVNWSDSLIPRAILRSGGTGLFHITASPIVIGDKVLVINAFSNMTLFDAQTGIRIWSKDIGAVSQPAVIDKEWAFVLSDTDLLCISLKNGAIKWRTNEPKKIIKKNSEYKKCTWYGPLIINNQVWIFNNFANILKYDISSGKYLEEIYLHHVRHRSTPIIVNNTMYSSVYGSIYAIG